jgi:MarR family transcriptional regulator, organic hydroperoxide resistance regulator
VADTLSDQRAQQVPDFTMVLNANLALPGVRRRRWSGCAPAGAKQVIVGAIVADRDEQAGDIRLGPQLTCDHGSPSPHDMMTKFEHKIMPLSSHHSHGADGRLPEVLQFMQVLWAVVHGLDRTSKRMTRDLGVTGPQRLVLRVVGLFPGVSAGDLAAILHVHPSTLTGVLQRLLRQRLLTRRDDPSDRRRAVLSLTPRGARVNGRKAGTVEAAIALALADVGTAERVAARRVFERLAVRLGVTPERASVAVRRHSQSGLARTSRHADP